MNKYDKQIEGILQLRKVILAVKDERISDLETKLQDQYDEIKNIKKTVSYLKSDNKKNVEKLSK